MTFDVVIIGGGLVGASLAAALQSGDLSVALVENHAMEDRPASDGEWDSRVYAISPGCAAFLAGSKPAMPVVISPNIKAVK